MTFDEWLASSPAAASTDPLWKTACYRLSAYAAHVVWADVQCLGRRTATAQVAGQLFRAVGSIGANIAEGYGRSSGRERARFLEFALGSARESRHWYRMLAPPLGPEVVGARCDVLDRISRLLVVMIQRERTRKSIEAGSR